MSDNIIIDVKPASPNNSDNIIIDVKPASPNNIVVSTLESVMSVNGKVGAVVLNKDDIGLDQVDNTSDLNKPISNSTLSALLLKVDLSLLEQLSGNWETAYLNVISNSAAYLSSVDLSFLSVSSNWNSSYTTVFVNSSFWITGYEISTVYQSNSSTYVTYDYLKNNFLPLSGGIIEGSLDVQTKLLSAGTDLFDIFLTSETDSQTLSYSESEEELSISSGNVVSLSALSYRNIEDPTSMIETIEQFAYSYNGPINLGYNVTLYNGRVYTFAGTDKNNPNHYLEVNTNPYLPIYREVPLSGNQIVLDSFYLGDFKSAKYNLQIETNFNNDIYYSEINVVGSVQTSTGVVCEYGQIYTNQLILGYDVEVSFNTISLIMLYGNDEDINHKLLVKGHRTNFYKI